MRPETLLRFVRWALPKLAHVEVTGSEKIPDQGPVIVAINHLGLLDVPLGYYALNSSKTTGWVADKHKKNPFYAYLVNVVDGIWLNRENADMQALRKALAALEAGCYFGVAPEGTRSPIASLLPGKEGVAYLALASNAPILPAGLTGTETVLRDWWRLRRPQLTITFGDPFHLPPLDRTHRQQQMEQGIEEIMCRIAALLPPKYRGVYAGHPRLKELLGGAT